MGKRYVCDYCDKSMVATPSIVRTHNNGMVHQKLVQDHYQQFKDPETILAEESKKKPCTRFANGECQFGSICRFSHYSREYINALGEYVATKKLPTDVILPSFKELFNKLLDEKKSNKPNQDEDNHHEKNQSAKDGNTILLDSNGVTHVFPWSYNKVLDSYDEPLPPSIKRFKIEDFAEGKIETWG